MQEAPMRSVAATAMVGTMILRNVVLFALGSGNKGVLVHFPVRLYEIPSRDIRPVALGGMKYHGKCK